MDGNISKAFGLLVTPVSSPPPPQPLAPQHPVPQTVLLISEPTLYDVGGVKLQKAGWLISNL